MKWYAVYTKPKREDGAASALRNAGVEVFNPKLKQRKYSKGAYKDMIGPLFPCYLFVRFEATAPSRMIKYTRGIRKIVGGDSPWPVPDEIIDLLKSREEDGLIALKPPELRGGDRVKITQGPMQGLDGIFEREIGGQERVILLLNAIEYQARVVIEKSFLMKAA